jgi:hypothetical protein
MQVTTVKNDIKKVTVLMPNETLEAVEKHRAALQAQTGVKLSLSALMHALVRASVTQREHAIS